MDVVQIEGEPFRLYVQSSSRAGVQFLVELDAFDFNGQCSCEDFSMRRIDDVRSGKESQCKHLRCAERWWAKMMMRRIKQELGKQGYQWRAKTLIRPQR